METCDKAWCRCKALLDVLENIPDEDNQVPLVVVSESARSVELLGFVSNPEEAAAMAVAYVVKRAMTDGGECSGGMLSLEPKLLETDAGERRVLILNDETVRTPQVITLPNKNRIDLRNIPMAPGGRA